MRSVNEAGPAQNVPCESAAQPESSRVHLFSTSSLVTLRGEVRPARHLPEHARDGEVGRQELLLLLLAAAHHLAEQGAEVGWAQEGDKAWRAWKRGRAWEGGQGWRHAPARGRS